MADQDGRSAPKAGRAPLAVRPSASAEATGRVVPAGATSTSLGAPPARTTGPLAPGGRSQRAAAPMRRSRQQDRGPRTEYLAFTLGGDVYAAPVTLVREILKPPPLTPVPRAPHQFLGIVSVRGQLVTVMDLRRRMRLVETAPSRRTRILLVDATGGEVMGVMVDEVLQVYRLAEGEIEPAATALGGEVASYIVGIARPNSAAAPVGISRRTTVGAPAATGSASGADASVVILLDLRAVLAS